AHRGELLSDRADDQQPKKAPTREIPPILRAASRALHAVRIWRRPAFRSAQSRLDGRGACGTGPRGHRRARLAAPGGHGRAIRRGGSGGRRPARRGGPAPPGPPTPAPPPASAPGRPPARPLSRSGPPTAPPSLSGRPPPAPPAHGGSMPAAAGTQPRALAVPS